MDGATKPKKKWSKEKKQVMALWLVSSGLTLVFFGVIYATTNLGRAVDRMGCRLLEERFHSACSIVPDLDAMCSVAGQAEGKQFKDAHESSAWFNGSLLPVLKTKEGIKLLRRIGILRTEGKWQMVRDAAEANGAPDWTCPKLERFLLAEDVALLAQTSTRARAYQRMGTRRRVVD